MNLRHLLIQNRQTRWLDIGCGGKFDTGFHYLDLFPESLIQAKYRRRYFRLDVTNMPDSEFDRLGKFDFIRMQQTFEHFSPEDGLRVLQNCARILVPGGRLLITVPDLQIHIHKYLTDSYKNWSAGKWWADRRIPAGAPASFYFSIFTHSLPFEPHKWCYDFAGLNYQLSRSGYFKDVTEIKLANPLAEVSFTHSRPEEDLCVIATRKPKRLKIDLK